MYTPNSVGVPWPILKISTSAPATLTKSLTDVSKASAKAAAVEVSSLHIVSYSPGPPFNCGILILSLNTMQNNWEIFRHLAQASAAPTLTALSGEQIASGSRSTPSGLMIAQIPPIRSTPSVQAALCERSAPDG